MSLTFPLALSDFFAGLRVTTSKFTLGEGMNADQTGQGEILTAKTGSRLWQGQIMLAADHWADMNAAWAKIEFLRAPGRPFYIYDTTAAAPAGDPTGFILGTAAPQIATLPSDATTLTLSGLPPGYLVTGGDMLAFPYLTGPVRQALHRVVIGGLADASGTTAELTVTPPIRAGAAVGAAVELIQPACLAVYTPGSAVEPTGQPGDISAGASFKFIQTLRI